MADIICEKIKVYIGIISQKLCEQKSVEIVQAKTCPRHIHMLVEVLTNLKYCTDDRFFKEKKCTGDIL